ncbi:MAG: nuclear transport factor 2 family protein [Candidatus Binatus sp.]|jgi:ketosteroid isomerase-like protein|uniref:nuclear transport factor 2 family protein n=1 Tax=Candidatus Binatus sp. TaxID=2811406 RepID=UPI003C7302B9
MNTAEERNAQQQREIEALEQQEARAMCAADVSTLQTLWADDLIVNSTANLIVGKQILLEMVKTGRLRLRTYERRPVKIATFGDLVVTTGNEASQLVGETAEYKMFVSYMNVWTKREGNWQLLARHVGLIAKGKPEPLQ